MTQQKALELIGKNLQAQYERWQPKARYKQSLDPNVESVKKLCTSLRRNAKEERVLFHYNGHGVPRPTTNGEIWVFNESYTQYIPLSIYDLQTWMGAPSIYVYDCSNAGTIVNSFHTFAEQHERELEQMPAVGNRSSPAGSLGGSTSFKNCIQLAACGANEILPMNPNLPADLFTSCLTTPIKIALKWYTLQKNATLVPHISYENIEKIPGQLNDRRTMLGELNWIFTAITDTIAWNILPRDLFQMLFRQDLLVASLFRNFLLAERILRSYGCTPVSSPALPESFRHPMWDAWDLALDQTLSQLPDIIERNKPFKNSPFFEEQLRAFEVWLEGSSEKRSPPEQLPIVLQVLLSQVHRTRALELLGRFLDLGPWAVNLALSVGIFPYVLKLLQSSAIELRPFLVFIWVKILAVDCTCQIDLVKDAYHKYFLGALQDQNVRPCIVSAEYHTYAAFVLASISHNFPIGQENCLQGSLISICLDQLNPGPTVRPNPRLRQWLIICLGHLWQNFERARWSGGRDMAHEKLYSFLQDPVPEVRAAVVYALGTFISSVTQRSEHANNTDRSIAMTLLTTLLTDASPIVRLELIATLQWMVIFFENQFIQVALQEGSSSQLINPTYTHSLERNLNMRRVGSSSSIQSQNPASMHSFNPHALGSIIVKIWGGFQVLCCDPYPDVSRLAKQVVQNITNQVAGILVAKEGTPEKLISVSLPPSPNTRVSYLSQSPPVHNHINQRKTSTNEEPETSLLVQSQQNRYRDAYNNMNTSTQSSDGITIRARVSHDSGGSNSANNSYTGTSQLDGVATKPRPIVTTNYIKWSVAYFVRNSHKPSSMAGIENITKHSASASEYLERLARFKKNRKVRSEGKEEQRRAVFTRLETQCYGGRTQHTPSIALLHPYESLLAVAYRDRVALHDWTTQYAASLVPSRLQSPQNSGSRNTFVHPLAQNFVRVSSLNFINEHDIFQVLVGYEDGVIRIWKPSERTNEDPKLVTAWQGLGEIGKGAINLKTAWHQETQTIFAAGESRVIRLWDADKELKICDITTGTESGVVELVCNRNGLCAAGCTDGSIRLYDKRLPATNARVETYCEYIQPVLSVCLRADCESLIAAK